MRLYSSISFVLVRRNSIVNGVIPSFNLSYLERLFLSKPFLGVITLLTIKKNRKHSFILSFYSYDYEYTSMWLLKYDIETPAFSISGLF